MAKLNVVKGALISVALISAAGFFVNHQKSGETAEVTMSLKEYLLATFLAELPEINRNLPHKLDENTDLLSIRYQDGKVINTYRLVDRSSADFSDPEFIRKAKNTLQKQGCMSEAKKRLLDVDVDFLERYQDADDKLIFEFLLNRSVCSGFSQSN